MKKSNLTKKIQIENSEKLKSFTHMEKKKAKEVLELAKKLNRPVRFLDKSASKIWEKEQAKINYNKSKY